MNLHPLQPFLKHSSKSSNILVKKAAEGLLDQAVTQPDEEIAQPVLHQQEPGKGLQDVSQDPIDKSMHNVMVDISKDGKTDKSQFGKTASAYASDVIVGSLPKATQEDIYKFTPAATKKTKVVQYGMVVAELVNKVDQHNYKVALAHVQNDIAKNGKRAAADKFQEKNKDKYILILNDSIIDGHHFLALADKLGISCSLKVLDLTPVRFQMEKKSMYQALAGR